MSDSVKWGIVATGSIARKFAQGLKAADNAELVAVASRAQESADAFAEEFNVPNRHVGTEALAADADVDVVYVATPHSRHKADTIACLDGGKHVLCEKPFAMNSAEVSEMVECASKNKLFLMEAMWTHFFPAMIKLRELLAAGTIGEVRLVQSNFCFRTGWNPESRLLNPELGGGALLDVGVYNIALAHKIYGQEPSRIDSQAHIGETGVDEQSSMVFGYENGAMAVLTNAVRTSTPHDATVYGTDGYIKIAKFWQPDGLIVKTTDNEEETSFERLGNGYAYEAIEVMNCIKSGALESDVMPLEKSISIMKTMDAIREQWGLRYPME